MSLPENALQNTEIFSVTRITEMLKDLIEGSFPFVTIEGEISNYRPSSTGHIYFTLKDETAAIAAVLFKGKARSLSFIPRDGIKVRASGSLSVYGLRGSYQIIVEKMEESGSGEILKLLEERKQKLAAEGLFDNDKKQPLPFFPERIGIVTSPTGAALRDILQITRRRNPKVSVTILPCAVQGAEAAEQICMQIRRANMFSLADVLIVGRGGGSLEDLLPFSEESTVRAVFESKIPVISAVGHEIDWALSDFAADIRAPTPSAAAELAVPLLDRITQDIQSGMQSLCETMQNRVQNMRLLVKSFSAENLELKLRSIEQPILQRFDDAKEELLFSVQERIDTAKQRIAFARRDLEAANPRSILERGYSVVTDSVTGHIIKDASQTVSGQNLLIQPYKGNIRVIVTKE
ncbi:exodeoxyribonuclease VII large subunit [Treponema sp. OMZ 840]|uniref:exodeoxyribonuclease VII large subunit n=1 Tax=Treponema sp. OMZ 840 TaxID=244313 RepID=UPI003D8FE580